MNPIDDVDECVRAMARWLDANNVEPATAMAAALDLAAELAVRIANDREHAKLLARASIATLRESLENLIEERLPR